MGLLYSKFKMFHYGDRIDALPLSAPEIEPPLQIRIKPTNVCAHDCWYCAYRASNLQLGKDMVIKDHIPKDKMLEIIDDISEMGVKSVTFSGGGDPFHYPYLTNAAKRLLETSVKFASLTHGARLDGEIAELFSKYATWIRISIDGWDDESYAKYRSVKVGEFSRVMQNIESFQKLNGNCYLGVSLIVDKDNYSHVYELTKKLRDIGVQSVKISGCVVSNSGKENNDYHKPFYQIAKDEAQRCVSDLSKDGFEVFDSYHALEEKFDKEYSWCPYLQLCPVIGADLNVYACHDKAYNLDDGVLFSIKDRRFKDGWMNNKEQFFKINPSVNCNNHCVVNEKNKMLLEYLALDKNHLEFV
jgi:MoaA/NifB/PqqE/SkfB family radical SAM enzyme